MPLLIALIVLTAVLFGWYWWRRYSRGQLARQTPDSYVLPLDPAWSRTVDGIERDRTLALKTAVNLRDIGGYPAANGSRIKWGLIYRSGTLYDLSDDDAAALAERGIKLICDFRSEHESSAAPDDAAKFGARYEPMPLEADHSSMRRLRVAMFQPLKLRELMRESYNELMLERNAPLIGRFLRLIAEDGNLPVLFHCTAGKDRTGMAAMILMSLLGVPDEVISADYSLSNAFHERFRVYVGDAIKKLRWLGMNVDDLYPLLIADPELMRGALESVRQRYGSVESYVINRCGVDAATISKLRELLLEESA
jgi:protein-tyrosine phosphatase